MGFVFIVGYFTYSSTIYSPIDELDTQNISFQIEKGAAVKTIAANLEEKGLIKNDFTFYLYAKSHNLGEKIVAGKFMLNKSMTVPQIIEEISNPEQSGFVITIQEGLRLKDIDQKLVDLELINSGEFLTSIRDFEDWDLYSFISKETHSNLDLSLEGYIYPDTYFLDPLEFEPQDLIYLGLDNFEQKYFNNIDSTQESQITQNYTKEEIIIMASIIENEVFGETDRAIVSGMLWKRLENGWTIGADATLLYITDDRTITAADLELDSPYNTRKFQGLPPGPICNPSTSSIKAAMYPTESEYWFYLTTLDTGEVIYAKSNEEHNVNKGKYL